MSLPNDIRKHASKTGWFTPKDVPTKYHLTSVYAAVKVMTHDKELEKVKMKGLTNYRATSKMLPVALFDVEEKVEKKEPMEGLKHVYPWMFKPPALPRKMFKGSITVKHPV